MRTKTVMLDSINVEVHGPRDLSRAQVRKLHNHLSAFDWQAILRPVLDPIVPGLAVRTDAIPTTTKRRKTKKT